MKEGVSAVSYVTHAAERRNNIVLTYTAKKAVIMCLVSLQIHYTTCEYSISSVPYCSIFYVVNICGSVHHA